jgi:hypothetical protein
MPTEKSPAFWPGSFLFAVASLIRPKINFTSKERGASTGRALVL